MLSFKSILQQLLSTNWQLINTNKLADISKQRDKRHKRSVAIHVVYSLVARNSILHILISDWLMIHNISSRFEHYSKSLSYGLE